MDARSIDLSELIALAMENRIEDVWTAIPATVHEYRATPRPEADLIPGVLRPVQSVSGGDPVDEEIPILPSIPVLFQAAGPFSITFPIAKGTPGLVVVLTLSAAQWRAGPADGAKAQPAGDLRRHSIGNAVFLPGFAPDALALPGADVDALVLRGPEIRLVEETAARHVAIAELIATAFTGVKSAFDSLSSPPSPAYIAPTAAQLRSDEVKIK